MDIHQVSALVATIGNIVAGLFYIFTVFKKHTKPHVFTWLVWGTTNGIGAAVAFSEGAQSSFYVLSTVTATCLLTALVGLWKGDKYIKKSDIIALFAAFSIIPIWASSKDAFVAALLICAINICGCYPTYRKAWVLPFEEHRNVFAFYGLTNFLGLIAVSPFTLTSALYPAVIFLSSVSLAFMITWRRKTYTVSADM